ncbi:hypothetical protein QZH41_004261 [Actinostola sp. cb2023]|nr:hypothetical protein QZH41_004261 [Actinostola sp. cb2023]
MRVGGRIHNAPVVYDTAHPFILPKDHYVSTLIVRHYHKLLGHAGREHVLSAIRQCYWIVNARSIVRRLLKECVTCRKRNAPVLTQMMADLPKERLTYTPYQPPFTYTGIDFFGPFYIKRGRGTEKVYACIFVCFNSRAIHIEDVSSLETDTFIQALRRFMSVRGCPKEIWSDNGTNFVGAEKEIRRSIQQWNAKKPLRSPSHPNIQSPHRPNFKSPPNPNAKTPPRPNAKTPPHPNVKSPPRPNVKFPPHPNVKSPPHPNV